MNKTVSRRAQTGWLPIARGVLLGVALTAALVAVFALLISLFPLSDGVIRAVNQLTCSLCSRKDNRVTACYKRCLFLVLTLIDALNHFHIRRMNHILLLSYYGSKHKYHTRCCSTL